MSHLQFNPLSPPTENDNQSLSDNATGQFANFQVNQTSIEDPERISLSKHHISLNLLDNRLASTTKLNSLAIYECQGQDFDIERQNQLSLNQLTRLDIFKSNINSHFIRHLLSSTPSLVTLILKCSTYRDNLPFHTLLPRSLSNVTCLDLCGSTLSYSNLIELLQATSALESLTLKATTIIDADEFMNLVPNSLNSIKKLDMSTFNINYLLPVLRACPNLESLTFAEWRGTLTNDNSTNLSFPNLKELDVGCCESDTDPGAAGLLYLTQLMPNLTKLHIYYFSQDFANIQNVLKDKEPMKSLIELRCDNFKLSEEVLECLLTFFPNVVDFPLALNQFDYSVAFHDTCDSEDSELDEEDADAAKDEAGNDMITTEKLMRKYARLISKGFRAVDISLRKYMDENPVHKKYIDQIIASEAKQMELDNGIAANEAKHPLEDREDSAPKKLREG